MSREDTKTRVGFWVDNNLLRRCDECWKANDFASRNDFVNHAIEEFITTTNLKNMDDAVVGRLQMPLLKPRMLVSSKFLKDCFGMQ